MWRSEAAGLAWRWSRGWSGALAALLAYSPLWEKHVTYVLPPLAILAGVGRRRRSRCWRRGGWSGGAWRWACRPSRRWSWSWRICPTLAAGTRAIVYRHAGSDLSRYADDLEIVKAATRARRVRGGRRRLSRDADRPPDAAVPGRSLLESDPGARADRRAGDQRDAPLRQQGPDPPGRPSRAGAAVPDLGRSGVRAGEVVRAAPAGAVSAGLRQPGRRSGSLSARHCGPRWPRRPTSESGRPRCSGTTWSSREIKPGSRVDLTLMFEALQNRPPEHALITRLRDRSGETAWEGEWKVGDGTQELHTWAGRRLAVPDAATADRRHRRGQLHADDRACSARTGNAARVEARSGARAWGSGDEVDLGEVLVVR